MSYQQYNAWLDAANAAADMPEHHKAIKAELKDLAESGAIGRQHSNIALTAICYADHCTAQLLARIAELEAAQTWQPIESALKDGRTLLITYTNRCCKHRIILARWLTDEQVAEIDADGVGLKGGWYEQVDNWDEYSEVAIESEPTHWMPLPTPPKGGAS